MNSLAFAPPTLPPVVLGVDLTITQHENLRQSLRTAFGLKTRTINLQIDSGLDLVFLCEIALPGSLPCLTALTRPGVAAVTLRSARLEWLRDPDHCTGRGTSTLAALESGNCFLTTGTSKIPIATFTSQNVHSTHVTMELAGRPNLLEYLRSDWFTLEISGTNRRRLSRPLAFQAVLEFDLRMATRE